MKDKLKVPKLRFKEFSGEWEENKLGNITYKVGKKNKDSIPLPIYSINNIVGFVPQSEQFEGLDSNNRGYDISLYKIINEKTFAYNPARINVGSIGYSYNLDNIIISSLYVCFKTVDEIADEFIYIYLKSKKFLEYVLMNVEGGVREYLFYENFSRIPFVYPTLPEQQKIADFLSKVDEKIEKLTKKKELLEQYKKGVMQKIFSQELRFKDDNGNDFPEWEEKELNSLGNSYSGLSGKSGDDFGSGLPYITYKSIFDNIRIDLKKVGYVNVGENESQTEVRTGDIFFTTSSETHEEVGMSSVLLDEVYERCFLNSFCFGFRFNSFEETMPMFMGYYFRSKKMRDKITSLAQGSTRYNLPKTKFLKILINIPSLQEQQKIADFLSVLDKKIDIVNKELGQVQEFKKGLLQQMFV